MRHWHLAVVLAVPLCAKDGTYLAGRFRDRTMLTRTANAPLGVLLSRLGHQSSQLIGILYAPAGEPVLSNRAPAKLAKVEVLTLAAPQRSMTKIEHRREHHGHVCAFYYLNMMRGRGVAQYSVTLMQEQVQKFDKSAKVY